MMKPCVDCGGQVEQSIGRGRPRVRCANCSPAQRKPPGSYVRPPGTYSRLSQRDAKCANCGSGFSSKLPNARFCGRKCNDQHANRAKQERARDRSPRPCGYCGTEFTPLYGDMRRVFCSAACSDRQRWKERAGTTHRRRAKRYGRVFEPVDRIAVFNRDGWRCKLCGIETPRAKLSTREHDAPELDHVVPLARGGDHTFENTQCACHDCNLFKGDRTETELADALAS